MESLKEILSLVAMRVETQFGHLLGRVIEFVLAGTQKEEVP